MEAGNRRSGSDRRIADQRSDSRASYDGAERRVSERRSSVDRRKSERMDPA